MSRQRVLREIYRANKTKGDPGDTGTITIQHFGMICAVTTTGAETRTLAQPTQAGLLCGVVLDVDGGNLTLTVTGGYDQAASTTITYGDAGDSAFFYSIKEGSSYFWRLFSCDGVTGPNLELADLSVDTIIVNTLLAVQQGAPTAETTAATLTIAELLTRIITGTHAAGSTQAYTVPTGTLMSGGTSLAAGDSFDWVLINLSAAAADTITLTAGADHTLVGNPIVQSAHVSTGGIYGNSAQFRSRMTAATTWITYRIA